jgi:glycerol-3-phosphate dehydrogenase (NAD(P)+)
MNVDLPICKQIYSIAYEGKDPRRAVIELMTRQPKAELV